MRAVTSRAGPIVAGAKKLFVKSYGCQMNVYDAARMVDALAPEGYVETARMDEADLVVLNTCHIRERAVEKVYSELGRVRVLKAERAGRGEATRVVVAGCVAQAEGAEIARRARVVDLVVGPQSLHRLPDLLRRADEAAIVETDFPVESKFDHLPAPTSARTRARGVAAFLTVQEGCDKFCAFCVVPYTRGAEASRSEAEIVAEARALVQSGVRELTLLGQNVNAWAGADGAGNPSTLARLIRRLAALPGLARLRYTTSHPRDMGADLVAAHRDVPALMPYLHLPVQSGSDRILAAMNRGHDAADYLRLIDRVRAVRPDIALSSDFIVGFPGETEEDFAATLRLVEAIGFAAAYSFKYSPRHGTPAAAAPDQVPEAVRSERLHRLQALLAAQSAAFNRASVGREVEVLLERPGRRPGQLAGKSPHLQTVQIEAGDAEVGDVVAVRIVEAGTNSLFGRRIGTVAA